MMFGHEHWKEKRVLTIITPGFRRSSGPYNVIHRHHTIVMQYFKDNLCGFDNENRWEIDSISNISLNDTARYSAVAGNPGYKSIFLSTSLNSHW